MLSGLADGAETLSVALETDIEARYPDNRDTRATADGAGNVTGFSATGSSYGFDGESRMVASTVNGVATGYEYDGEGRRVRKTGAAATVYVYTALGELAQEYGGVAGESGRRYLTADQLGSTRLTTDGTAAAETAKRYDYTPFGRQLFAGDNGRDASFPAYEPPGTDPLRQRFTGKERDGETGLDYFGARYFSAAQDRFTNPDPDNIGAVKADPQSWNAYGYVRNNPLRFTDPLGLNCLN